MEWKLAEAKNKLSELVTLATTQGPQTIRRHDAAVVVIAEQTYLALTGERPDFNDWLLNGPRIDDLELPDRKQSTMRPVDL
jgi:hypothetical protein